MNTVVSVASLASAAAVASPIPATVAKPSAVLQEGDELIFELARQHENVVTQYNEWDIDASAREREIAVKKLPPAVLKVRRGEIATFGRILNRRGGVWKNYWDHLCSLRIEVLQTPPVDKKALADLRALSKSERQRLDEIVAAAKAEWDGLLESNSENNSRRRGIRKIENQRSRWLGSISKIERRMAKVPARTVAGMSAKLRCSLWINNGVLSDDVEGDELIQSILQDVYRLGGASAADQHFSPV